MKRSRPFRFLFLALLLLVPTPTARAAAPATPTDFPAFSIAFVGNSVVDLMWDPASGVDHYRLERSLGGHIDPVTPETIDGRLFYRDTQASGTDIEYRICAVFPSDETCSEWRMVHVGQVEGNLHKDLEWRDAVIELASTVTINTGATLRVTDGADVSPMPSAGTKTLQTIGTGTLQVVRESGAPPALRDITVSISDSGGSSVMTGTENQLVILDGVAVTVHSSAEFQYVSATNGTVLGFTSVAAGESIVSSSSLVGAKIRLVGGWANIHHNSFQCGDCIRLRDGAVATIEDNIFDIDYVTDGIDIGGSDAAIRRNTFRPDGFTSDELAAAAVRIWPDAGSVDQVAISDNSFVADTYRTGVGLLLCGWDLAGDPPPAYLGPPEVTVTGNSFLSLARGIGVCDLIGTNVSGNSLSDNSQAIGVSADFAEGLVGVTGNCIAGNAYGLYGPAALPVSGNWWGSLLGPRYDTCSPPGAGDFVTGGADDYQFLTQNNCSAGVNNLAVHNIEATQAIQTLNNTVPLVTGKPTVVRVYPSSSTGVLSGVSGELVVRRGETELGTLQPLSSVDTIYLAPQCSAYNETELHSNRDLSLIFKLPAQWMSGTVTLAAEVNPTQSIDELTYADNTGAITVTVQPAPRPVRIGMVPVNPGDLTGPDAASLLAAGELFRTIYPGSDIETTILPTMQWTQGLPEPSFALDSGMAGAMLLNTLGLSQMRLQTQGGWAGPAVDQLHGVIVPDVLQHALSEPRVVGGRGTAAYGSLDQVVTAAATQPESRSDPTPQLQLADRDVGVQRAHRPTHPPLNT